MGIIVLCARFVVVDIVKLKGDMVPFEELCHAFVQIWVHGPLKMLSRFVIGAITSRGDDYIETCWRLIAQCSECSMAVERASNDIPPCLEA